MEIRRSFRGGNQKVLVTRPQMSIGKLLLQTFSIWLACESVTLTHGQGSLKMFFSAHNRQHKWNTSPQRNKLQFAVNCNICFCALPATGICYSIHEFSSSDYLVPAQPSVSTSGQFAICQLWMRLKIQFWVVTVNVAQWEIMAPISDPVPSHQYHFCTRHIIMLACLLASVKKLK